MIFRVEVQRLSLVGIRSGLVVTVGYHCKQVFVLTIRVDHVQVKWPGTAAGAAFALATLDARECVIADLALVGDQRITPGH